LELLRGVAVAVTRGTCVLANTVTVGKFFRSNPRGIESEPEREVMEGPLAVLLDLGTLGLLAQLDEALNVSLHHVETDPVHALVARIIGGIGHVVIVIRSHFADALLELGHVLVGKFSGNVLGEGAVTLGHFHEELGGERVDDEGCAVGDLIPLVVMALALAETVGEAQAVRSDVVDHGAESELGVLAHPLAVLLDVRALGLIAHLLDMSNDVLEHFLGGVLSALAALSVISAAGGRDDLVNVIKGDIRKQLEQGRALENVL